MIERLSEAMNTWSPALTVLRAKGYRLRAEDDPDAENRVIWVAEREGVCLMGGDPLIVLGLSALWEAKGAAWRDSGDQELYDRVLDGEEVLPDEPAAGRE